MNPAPLPLQEANDIFSISDQVLADRLQFIEEIGFGNWGSVWACRPKQDPSSPSTESPHAPGNTKIAVKLVHRSKTPTTAARVRSLWNEMKVVRSLKHEPHPSIIPFYSFIITPSYALITMAYHPRLVPVEVAEHHAKPWFRSLLSGIEFLHKRGVVHNDIKPANILLSADNVPVLVDFGFAERYELDSKDAFRSNLSYGTPEYLSPERARGLPHDTRKSDIWSLGITFFEILVGRTPFEHSEGEQFSTKEDLEKYWTRTMSGKWVGTWKMSPSIERMLRRMISPNTDLRYNASDAMADRYWTRADGPLVSSHRKTASGSHLRSTSMADIRNAMPSAVRRGTTDALKSNVEKARVPVSIDKENVSTPPVSIRDKSRSVSTLSSSLSRHLRTPSQNTLSSTSSRGVPQTKKLGKVPSLIASLSPIKHSPPATITTQTVHRRTSSTILRAKENVLQTNARNTVAERKPLVSQNKPTPPSSPSKRRTRTRVVQDENSPSPVSSAKKEVSTHRRSRVFGDASRGNRASLVDTPKETKKGSVTNRMREWERERQRLREMEEMEERLREVAEERQRMEEREREEELQRQRVEEAEAESTRRRELEFQKELQREQEREKEELERKRVKETQGRSGFPRITVRTDPMASSPPATLSHVSTPLSPLMEEPSAMYDNERAATANNESSLNILRQSLKMSLDVTKRIYKSSTQALAYSMCSRDSTPEKTVAHHEKDEVPSWEDEIIRDAKPSSPARREVIAAEKMANVDQVTMWMKNVEKVVEDARQSFAQSSTTTLPPLPVAPISRRSSEQRSDGRSNPSTRSDYSSRAPRRILAANHIFTQEPEPTSAKSLPTDTPCDENDASVGYRRSWTKDGLPVPPENITRASMFAKLTDGPSTPSHHRRRATILSRSPESSAKAKLTLDLELSPSKRREKSKSQNDLQMVGLGRAITPVNRLEFEIEQLSKPAPVPRLASLVDPSLFIGDNGGARSPRSPGFDEKIPVDELTAEPHIVEPYPARPPSKASLAVAVDTPAKKHLEGVYDRFLMSTTGVKRVGRGYQSETVGLFSQVPPSKISTKRSFLSSRKPMPPPISSEDVRRAASFNEFGVKAAPSTSSKSDESTAPAVSIVRRALKAITVKRL